jgi:AraC-like DNA-binding protein
MAVPQVVELEPRAALPDAAHRRAIERVIETMSERLDEHFSLVQLAAIAYFSPYHFHRLFRYVTGVPPGRFLTALRIEEAKRLLLTSELSVSRICLEVGYRSLGTFTSQFTRLVGISPRRLRAFARTAGWAEPNVLLVEPPLEPGARTAVYGRIDLWGAGSEALTAIGLFPTRLAEGRPAGCSLVPVPGDYQVASARRGSFHVLAVSIETGGCWNDLLLQNQDVRVAATVAPVQVLPGRPVRVDLALRPRRITDPPVLLAPALLVGTQAAEPTERQLVSA